MSCYWQVLGSVEQIDADSNPMGDNHKLNRNSRLIIYTTFGLVTVSALTGMKYSSYIYSSICIHSASFSYIYFSGYEHS